MDNRPPPSRRRRVLVTLLRLIALALVGFMLSGYLLPRHEVELPELVIVIDDSQSMRVLDTYGDGPLATAVASLAGRADLTEATRLDLAQTLLTEVNHPLLTQLGDDYQVKVFRAATTCREVEDPTEWARRSISQRREEASAAFPSNATPSQAGSVAALEDSEHQASCLGNSLTEVLERQRGHSTAAILVLTDGVVTGGRTLQTAAALASRRNVPLFFLGLGSDQPPPDVQLVEVQVPETTFVGDLLDFRCQVSSSGLSGRQVELHLRPAAGGPILARTTLTLTKNGAPQWSTLRYSPTQEGELEYAVHLHPLEEEVDLQNNIRQGRVLVSGEQIRVLLVQAYPSYEFRFLKSLLGRQWRHQAGDSGTPFQLTTVLQHADSQYHATDPTALSEFPLSRQELYSYDVIIFGDVDPTLLGPHAIDDLTSFVEERGGGIVFIAGPHYMPQSYAQTPLQDLLPFASDEIALPEVSQTLRIPFRTRPTPYGLISPSVGLSSTPEETLDLWSQLGSLYWLAPIQQVESGARVLLEAPDRLSHEGRPLPLAIRQYVGAGEVVFHATDETWRWRLRGGKEYYQHYWMQLLRDLGRWRLTDPSRVVSISTQRASYRVDEEIVLQVRFFQASDAPPSDDGVVVRLESQENPSRELVLHRLQTGDRTLFQARLKSLPADDYELWLTSPVVEGAIPSHRFEVTSPPGELTRIDIDAQAMRQAAQRSGGDYQTLAKLNLLVDALPAGNRVITAAKPKLALWNHPLIAVAFCLVLVGEWVLRKWWEIA